MRVLVALVAGCTAPPRPVVPANAGGTDDPPPPPAQLVQLPPHLVALPTGSYACHRTPSASLQPTAARVSLAGPPWLVDIARCALEQHDDVRVVGAPAPFAIELSLEATVEEVHSEASCRGRAVVHAGARALGAFSHATKSRVGYPEASQLALDACAETAVDSLVADALDAIAHASMIGPPVGP
jgi:hypothetical protein